MASLAPCSHCRRHLRRHEAQCPFCGAQQPPPPAPRRQLAIPRDASRATLLALGLTLVGQACGGRTDGDPVQNGSGASTGNGSGGSQGIGNPARGGAGGSGAPDGDDACANNPLLAACRNGVTEDRCTDNPLLPECSPVPPYGAMPYPLPGTAGAAGSGGTMNPGSLDAGAEDAGGDAAPDEDAGN
jgi:hypothetical protein